MGCQLHDVDIPLPTLSPFQVISAPWCVVFLVFNIDSALLGLPFNSVIYIYIYIYI